MVEGDRCVARARKAGLQATCASEGAGKWTQDLNHWFKDRIAWIIPDNDEPGRENAELVARNLHGVAKEVKIVDISKYVGEGEDIVEFFDVSGLNVDTLMHLGENTPLCAPSACATPP